MTSAPRLPGRHESGPRRYHRPAARAAALALIFAVLLLGAAAFGAARAEALAFLPAVDYGAGAAPYFVAADDLDGDGDQDLAVANAISNNVSVLFNNGSGVFGLPVNYGTGTYPSSVAVGDLDGDSDPDLVTANYSSGNVSVLFNDGSGVFGAPTNYAAGSGAIGVAVGDLDGDGKPDLAVANAGAGNVSVLFNNGSGVFGLPTDYATGALPLFVAVSDLDGDGDQDLAVANAGSDTVSIFLNGGSGSFGTATDFGVGGYPTSVAAGDVNGDGRPDLAVANQDDDDVSVLLNLGAGSFGAPTDYGAGFWPTRLVLANLDGDGSPDLAVTNLHSRSLSVLLNDGSGAFGARTDLAVGTYPISVASADLSGDGKPDLAVANNTSYNVSVLLQAQIVTPEVLDGPDSLPHGTITPSAPTGVPYGGSLGFVFTPDAHYHVETVTRGGVPVVPTPGTTWTLENVTADTTVTVQYALDTYPVTASAPGGHGDITPHLATVGWGQPSGEFTIAPDPTYHLDVLTDNGVDVTDQVSGGSYEIASVEETHALVAAFANAFEIVPSVVGAPSGHGRITPAGAQTATYGATPTFSFSPDTGYYVSQVLVDGVPVSPTPAKSYTFPPVTADHTISVAFALSTYAVTAVPLTTGGSVSPLGTTWVPFLGSLTVSVTPAAHYHTARVTIDGAAVRVQPAYTFVNVSSRHRLEAAFALDRYTVTPSVVKLADGRAHGCISPATTGSYVWGSTPRFTFTSESGYAVFEVRVDGVQLLPTPRTSYTFAALTGPHTISVRFVKGYVPTAQ
jgi:hypothetical protein